MKQLRFNFPSINATLAALFWIFIALETPLADISPSDWVGVVGGDKIGYVKTISDLTNITGVMLIMPGENESEDGAYTLWWDASSSELTWDSGSPVSINASINATYQLYDSSGNYIYAVTNVTLLPVSDESDSVTINTISATNGFGLGAHLESVLDLKAFNGYLYAGLEGYPDGERVNLYRSIDGIIWTKVFDDKLWGLSSGADHADDLIVFNGILYLTVGGFNVETEGGMEVWASPDGLLWERVVYDGFSDFSTKPIPPAGNGNGTPTIVFDGYLYVATINFDKDEGAQIWRTNDGVNWEQTGFEDFGIDPHDPDLPDVVFIEELLPYDGDLYAFDFVWSDNPLDFGRVWRTANGMAWEVIKTFEHRQNMVEVVEYQGEMYGLFADRTQTNWQVHKSQNGIDWEIVSADIGIPLVAGTSEGISELYVYSNGLYLLSRSDGLVWHSSDAVNWTQINTTDFGDTSNNALWTILAYEGNLYVGFFNNSNGIELWRSTDPTFVELAWFKAIPFSNGVWLQWKTQMEINNTGFILWRVELGDVDEQASWIQLNDELIYAKGDDSEYGFIDTSAEPGKTYEYWLEDIDLQGLSILHNLDNGPVIMPLDRVFSDEQRVNGPADKARLGVAEPPVFSWEPGQFKAFKIQYALSGSEEIYYVPTPGWLSDTQLVISADDWTDFAKPLLESGQSVFWRVLGRDENGLESISEIRQFSLTD